MEAKKDSRGSGCYLTEGSEALGQVCAKGYYQVTIAYASQHSGSVGFAYPSLGVHECEAVRGGDLRYLVQHLRVGRLGVLLQTLLECLRDRNKSAFGFRATSPSAVHEKERLPEGTRFPCYSQVYPGYPGTPPKKS